MTRILRVAVIGDFEPSFMPHVATNDALLHSASALDVAVNVDWVPTQLLESELSPVRTADAVWCAPGSPYRSLAGAVAALRHGREEGIPTFGTCGGFQHMVIEFARNVLGYADARHAEYDPYSSALFVSQLSCSLAGQTMSVDLQPGSKVAELCGGERVRERYYCDFGLNPMYQRIVDEGGLHVVGVDGGGEARVLELSDHPFYVATLFVPQMRSTPDRPHPLIAGFLRAAIDRRGERRNRFRASSVRGDVPPPPPSSGRGEVVASGTPTTIARGIVAGEHEARRRHPHDDRLIRLAERIQEALWIHEPGTGHVAYVSPNVTRVFGLEVEEVYEDAQRFVGLVHDDDRERVRAEIRDVRFDVEYRIGSPDGELRWVRTQGFPIAEDDLGVCQVAVVSMDVTGRRRAQTQQAVLARLGILGLAGMAPERMMHEAALLVGQAIGVARVGIFEQASPDGSFVLRARSGWGFEDGDVHEPASRSLLAHCLAVGRACVVSDWAAENRLRPPTHVVGAQLRSTVAVPIEGRSEAIGAITVSSNVSRVLDGPAQEFLTSVAHVLGTAIDRTRSEEATRHQAFHDPLTGLPNRVLFHDRAEIALARLARHGGRVAIVLLDLDGFKEVNDDLGHQAGDDLLRQIADRLRAVLRTSDTVARMGGDEFAAVVEGLQGPEESGELVWRIERAFAAPFPVGGEERAIGASIGIVLTGDPGTSIDALIRDADAAMYQAKGDRRSARMRPSP